MTVKLSSFRSGGIAIAYEHIGTGPLLIFLHGVGGNKSNWLSQLHAFKNAYHCVAWDARGYGDSDDPDGELLFTDFADDLKNLIDHLDAPLAHIVGLSMGGFIAQDFHARYPDRVATLTLASTSPGMGLLTPEQRQDFLAKRLAPLETGLTVSDMADAVLKVLIGPRADDSIHAQLRTSLQAVRTDPYKQVLHALVTTDFRKQLLDILVPVLVVVGADDRVLPAANSEYLAEHIRNSELHIIPYTGHLCNIEAPEQFNAILAAFLLKYKDQFEAEN